MPPRSPKLASNAAADYRFPTFEDLMAEADKVTGDLQPYQLPLSKTHIIEIQKPDGDAYLRILAAQRVGAEDLILSILIPDKGDLAAVRAKMKGAPMRVADQIIGNVLSYFYGTGLLTEAEEGNSPAS